MARKKPMFLRTDYDQYSKLGFRRKKKLVYRKAKGGENKQRLKMKGHLRNVSIGFRSEKKTRGLVRGLKPIIIKSVEDLKKLKNGEVAIIAKMGNKKRLAIAEYAFKNSIRISNLDSGKFIQKIQEAREKKKHEKAKKEKSKKEREKKSSEKSSLEKTSEKTGNKQEEKSEEKQEKSEEKEAKPTETNTKHNMEEIK